MVSPAAAAKQIHQGNLSARARVYTVDDMGKFGQLFNEMAENLEQTIRRLRISESKYRQIFENSRDCIFVTDTQCRIIDINDAGRKMLGMEPSDNIQQLSLNCCENQDRQDGNPVLQQDIQEKGYVKDYETWLQCPDGTIRHCRLTATSRYDKHGTLLGYEGILRDITEEKKLQEEIVLAEEREREILQLVVEGLTNQEISKKLCISTSTVDTHRKNIMAKLDIHSIAGLVKYAIRHKIVTL